MKTKIKITLTILLLSFTANNVNAQFQRGHWYGSPIVRVDNPVYAFGLTVIKYGIGSLISSGDNRRSIQKQTLSDDGTLITTTVAKNTLWKDGSWQNYLWPAVNYRANIFQKMEFANGKARINPKLFGLSHIDWAFRNYSLGYRFGYMPKTTPIGFEVEADYIQEGYQVRMPDNYEVQQSIIKRMLSGQVVMKYIFGDNLQKRNQIKSQFLVELGGGYQYALHYHDKQIHDKDAVNNGFIGILGAGVSFPQINSTITARYEHSFYDFYNDDFLYNGQPIYKGSKSTFGKLYTTWSMSF